MIYIVPGSDQDEASRLNERLLAMGLSATIRSAQQRTLEAPPFGETVFSHIDELAAINAYRYRVVAFGGGDRAQEAVQAIRAGAHEYLPKGADPAALIHHLQTPRGESVVAQSPAMQQTLMMASRVARTDVSVLINGPSGTGKEVVARLIHQQSKRHTQAYVAMNCAAIPESMLEAILFGHEKGAYTGAGERRIGKFELADGGTLLLDEITEMPLSLQAKLLRVLQEREVERLGGRHPISVDVRVLATSNRDLSLAVEEGTLREDLYYRLSVFPIQVPPLQGRIEDVLPLAEHFLQKYSVGPPLRLSDAAQQALQHYPWPGNVRELENVMQRAMVMANGEVIEVANLGLSEAQPSKPHTLTGQMRNQEEQVLLDALRANQGKRKITAQQLGISERTLRYKLSALKQRGVEL